MQILTALSLAVLVPCSNPQVHDGDSIRCGKERIRLASIDAPEMPDSPKCRDKGL